MAFEMTQCLWQDSAHRIVVSPAPQTGFLEQLATTRFQTDGQTYRRVNTETQARRLGQAHFLSLVSGSDTVGTYALSETPLLVDGQPARGFYRAMLTLAPAARGQGLGKQLLRCAREWMQEVSADASGPVFSWGCVAARNTPARQLLRHAGHQEIGTLSPKLEYQQWIRRVRYALSESVDERIETAWRHSQQSSQWHLADLPNSGWLTLAHDNQWIACQHHLTELDLTPVPGLLGWIDRHLMPWFPPGRRRFDPEHFRYVSVSSVIGSDGHESLWPVLRNALMDRYETHYVNRTRSLPDKTGLVVSVARIDAPGTKIESGGRLALWPPDL
ncbi:MAG: GNAT family N-acetyltransferase [Pseudomonadota bacterium]